MVKSRHAGLKIFLLIMDCLLCVISFILAGIWRFHEFERFYETTAFFELMLITLLSGFCSFIITRMYSSFIRRGYLRELISVIKYCGLMLLLLSLYTFSTKNVMALSRMTLVFFFPISLSLVYAFNCLLKRVCRSQDSNQRGWRLLIVTDAINASDICRKARMNPNWNRGIIEIYTLDKSKIDASELLGFSQIDPDINCMDYVARNPVDEVLLSVSRVQYTSEIVKTLLDELAKTGIIVSLMIALPQIYDYGVTQVRKIGDDYIASLAYREYDYTALIIKRMMDIVGGSIGILFTLIVGLFVAPAILIDSPGPVLFKQQRVSRNGRVFTMYKFRSMHLDAEARKDELTKQNIMKGPLFKAKNDPRITRVGRFIRRTSIDEMPQFLNVVKGDMSLVGTRPPTLEEYSHYSNYQKRRLSFRPGLTGIWQTSGRNDIIDFDDVIKLDIQYIQEWSVALDIKLILKTLKVIVLRKGAR